MKAKKRTWLLILICCLGFIAYYNSVYTTNHYTVLNHFQANFSKLEKELSFFVEQNFDDLLNNQLKDENFYHQKFNLHVYQQDSLIIWNTNKLPAPKYADLQFPANGIQKMQNGWYYVKTLQNDTISLSGSFLIRNEFHYQNAHLINDFVPPFEIDVQSFISLDEATGFPIYALDKSYLFSVFITNFQDVSVIDSLILMTLLLCTILIFFWQISICFLYLKTKWVWLFPAFIIVLRLTSLHNDWFAFMSNTELFKPSLYGTSWVFPNFFEYLLNICLIYIICHFVYQKIKKMTFDFSPFFSYFNISIFYFTWLGMIYLFKGLIENSSIPMQIEKFFQLNIYSVLAIFSIALLGFIYFVICKTIILIAQKQNVSFLQLLYCNIFFGILFVFYNYFISNQSIITILFPLVFTSFVIFLKYKTFQQKHLYIGMVLLAQYAFICSVTIGDFNQRKEKSERELYANQLIIERDIATEIEYSKLEKSILNDRFIQRMIGSDLTISQLEFEEGMERRHFNGFWERYDCNFYLFSDGNENLIDKKDENVEILNELNQIIANNSEQSEIQPSIYFVKNYINQYSYIIKQTIYGKDDKKVFLFVTLKSKKIPEEIGFPRLLIPEQAIALKNLDNYSIAKYHKGELVSQFGAFNYPTNLKVLNKANVLHQRNFNFNDFNHFVDMKSKDDAIVLSGKNMKMIDFATSFSYLFCLFGIMLIPVNIRFYSFSYKRKNLALSSKIQMALISLIIIALISSAISSGFFIRNQYRQYVENSIKEKTQSIELDLFSKIGKLNPEQLKSNESTLNALFVQLSKVFKTDINFYSPKGYLLATSRSKLFNLGLLSEQINPIAMKELDINSHSDFIHQENIGLLKYSSAYTPLFNHNNKLLGYINLQYFGQQKDVENQIQQFFVAIINIFVLLIALSTIFAIFVSNWITNPLLMLKNRFSSFKLNQTNQKINYHLNDEIGALVNSYNQKIEELEATTQQLIQSERESAWRDMAKQVAHEIKNPLTPMRLSIQHLLRSFDPNDANAHERINKVSNSLINQIDAITNIVNEFSNFAKMPKPNFEQVDITNIIVNVVEIFNQSSSTKISVQFSESYWVLGDKEQLLRVFNNIIKNSIQATNHLENGNIEITAEIIGAFVKINVTDNGIGMNDEQQQKVFTPYFTTKSTGSGIGLAMIKQIVNHHNGKIYFTSEENVGTTFSIELKLIK